MTELPPCQSNHVLMLQLSRGICSFAWMSFCFKVFQGDLPKVEKMLFSVYLKYSFSGSGLSEGWEGFLNIRGSNTTLKIQRSKLWGKAFKKWWYNYLWPGAGIWSDGVREITAKMFHCTWNRNKTNSALFKENENREPSNDSGRLWLKGSAAFWTVKSCFWFIGGLKSKLELCHFWNSEKNQPGPLHLRFIGTGERRLVALVILRLAHIVTILEHYLVDILKEVFFVAPTPLSSNPTRTKNMKK